ncbi:MAG: putative pyridoxal kinase [Claussenomyces sp. TS43310]|nr:MAG: putative pyridoxal kinase [Claussenomyces sp. TS43310]
MRTTAAEITDLFEGLRNSSLDDFDMMLSGYVPGAEAVEAVGRIARKLKNEATLKPGSFFWILDPVMGDNGKLYVAEEIVPVYRQLIREADLILPNQYEAEYEARWLCGIKIVDMNSLGQAIKALHAEYLIPHILITSVSFPAVGSTPSLSVVGSTITSENTARIFRIEVPLLDAYFSGTGDMLAALMVVRLREAVSNIDGLGQKDAWISPDDVEAVELPLAKAAEMALASMQEVLVKTKESRDRLFERIGDEDNESKAYHLKKTRAAEVNIVRNVTCLRNPSVKYTATKLDTEA